MKIGVVGAGVMGSGVAQRLAKYGVDAIVVDISQEALDNSAQIIKNNIRFANMVNRSGDKIAQSEVLERISFTTNYQKLDDVDFVIENINENVELKKEIYIKMDSICKKECIFMVNTSCISITKIASYTERKTQVIGVHFMNPVPMKKASEVIKGYHTSDETIIKVSDLLESLEIQPIIVNDYPGFVSNRISHLLMNEAANVVQDGVATAENVDLIFKMCFEHKMGPLETADLIGIDTVVDSLDVLFELYQDSKFRVSPLLRKMKDAGLLGRKSGEGFYKYFI